MNKKTIIGIAVIALVAIAAVAGCSKKDGTSAGSGSRTVKVAPESDFYVNVIDGGVVITGYMGDKSEVNIPPKIQDLPVISIGDNAFREERLINVTIPDSVTEILVSAFAYNQLTSINIPNGVTLINESAFYSNKLTSVTIPDNVFIGLQAFEHNPLISVTIGANVFLDRWVFDVGFHDAYDATGNQAGTYTRPNANSETWTKQ